MKHCGTLPIETPRLLLRAFMDEDCNDMIKNWIANPNVQSEYGEPVYTTISEVRQLLSKWKTMYSDLDFYRWAIIEKKSAENTELYKLEAYHRAENIKSGRVLDKSSMHVTDTVERFVRENKTPEGEVCYCITRQQIPICRTMR